MPITIRRLAAHELADAIPVLSGLLIDAVDGSTLGFNSPVPYDQAAAYWRSIERDLAAGTRILLVACDDDRIVGGGQLALMQTPNSRHRAEIHKLFVSSALRGRGVGQQIMAALHETAREHGRRLILLNTRFGGPAEGFYRRLGYQEIGVIPGYAMGKNGERYNAVIFCTELEPAL
jgi:GNAT superfamily N-acetyltransferase